MDDSSSKPSFFERLINKISGEDAPESHEEIIHSLRLAKDNQVLDQDTHNLLVRALAFADLEVRDVMVTRSQMDVIKIHHGLDRILDFVIETAHSRFPVIGEDKDQILGVLHAKDLLKYFKQPEAFDLHSLLRETVFVPEGKSLHALATEFRNKHHHLAIVVDEYGGVSGLVTFEDVLEEIIGEIEDEFDEDEEANIIEVADGRYRINAFTEIKEFNQFFHTDFAEEGVDTIGGLVISYFERLPVKGEQVTINGWQFTVTGVDNRRLNQLMAIQITE